MNQKGFIPILIAVLVVIVAAGGYFIYQQQAKTTPPITSTQTAIQSPPTSVDETINWKAYTNQQYKFSFKYPQDWVIKEETDQRRAFGLISVTVSSPTQKTFLDILVHPGTKEQLEKDLLGKATESKVGDIIAWVTKEGGKTQTLHFPSIVSGQTINIVYGVYPDISPQSEIQAADKILTTFKFIN